MTEASLRMDPRIKQRRIAVQRDAGRRRLRLLLIGVGVLIGVAALVGSLWTPLADVDRVDVVGSARTEPADVIAAAGLDRSPQLIDVDPAAVAARIEALPWIASAEVTRHWPSGVSIEVTERRPVAVTPVDPDGKQWALVDATGRVLAHEAGRPAGYPALSKGPVPGAPGTTLDAATASALAVAGALSPELRAQTGDIVVLPGEEVELALLPRGRVRLGRAEELAAKVEALATVLSRVDLQGIAVIDLRVPSAPAVTRG